MGPAHKSAGLESFSYATCAGYTRRMATTPAFTNAYKQLNPAQKQAVDTIDGPVMVVAGPGTGKTQILTLRIANILLSTDTPPDGILALTFTEAGVAAMKKRLHALIGPTSHKVRIHTFHGFCHEIIRLHPHHFDRIIGSQALTAIESVKFIRDIVDALPLEKLKPFGDPYYYVTDISRAISTLKHERKTPADVLNTTERLMKDIEHDQDAIHQKGVHKGKMKADVQKRLDRLRKEHELGRVYARYEEKLTEARRFDFEDMIIEVVRALSENDTLLSSVRDQYLYILADEHQDANEAQNRLLELLTSYDASPNLFIVGDEKQAIFRFQGALLDNFDRFQKLFPSATLIRLVESYRAGQGLLDASHALMEHADIPPERHPRLESRVESPHLAAFEFRAFTSEELEVAWVAQDIAARIAEGVPAGDIAVIFRNNKDAERISRALSLRGVLHTLDAKSNVFKEHLVAQLVTYLRLCTHIGDKEYLAHALHFPWTGIGPHDAYKAILQADKKRLPYIEVIGSRAHLTEANVRHPDTLITLAETLHRLARAAQEETARDFFDRVLHESGLLTYVLGQSDAVQALNSLRGIAATLDTLSATALLYSGRDFVRDLGLYETYGIEIEPDTIPKERMNAVHLVTAHGSKGLEYEHVYIIHARDGKWGNKAERNRIPLETLATVSESDIEDERRLFYVALTRAKRYVSVSYGVGSAGRAREAAPAVFMDGEIDPSLVTVVPTDAFEASVPPEAAFAVRPASADTSDEHAYIRDAFLEQGLSATALNNYLACPWRYFYRNLLRVPEKPTSSSLYGNALHAALERFRNLCKAEAAFQPLPILLEYLQVAIDNQGFAPIAYEEAHKKGVRALTDWHARNTARYCVNVLTEHGFEVYLPLAAGEPQTVLLRGKLDAIEFPEDGPVRVVDYKTGKHKSRNEILGGTKNATGDYKRQLDFYCILMELKQMDRPTTLALEFIEPDAKDKTATHEFAYDAEAVGELKETIQRVAGEIYALAFWDTRCDDTACEYCALRETARS